MNATQTLTEVEGNDWGAPEFDSHLVGRVHELRHKPLGDFTVEDLRITIGQSVGLPHLLPIALSILESDPMAEGDLFRGDLLSSVVRVAESFWLCNPALRARALSVAAAGRDRTDDRKDCDDCAHFVARWCV